MYGLYCWRKIFRTKSLELLCINKTSFSEYREIEKWKGYGRFKLIFFFNSSFFLFAFSLQISVMHTWRWIPKPIWYLFIENSTLIKDDLQYTILFWKQFVFLLKFFLEYFISHSKCIVSVHKLLLIQMQYYFYELCYAYVYV